MEEINKVTKEQLNTFIRIKYHEYTAENLLSDVEDYVPTKGACYRIFNELVEECLSLGKEDAEIIKALTDAHMKCVTIHQEQSKELVDILGYDNYRSLNQVDLTASLIASFSDFAQVKGPAYVIHQSEVENSVEEFLIHLDNLYN